MFGAAELGQGEPHAGRHRLEVMGVQRGRFLAEGEGDRLVGRKALGQRPGLDIVEVEHGLGRPAGEAAEQVAQLLHRLVVQRDVGDHGDGRVVAGDGAVGLIDFRDEQVGAADQGAGEGVVGVGEILHHRAVHDGRRAARLMQDPGDHAGDGRLAAGSGHADRGRGGVEQLTEELGAGDDAGTGAFGCADVGHGVLDGTGGYHGLVGARDARAVLRMQGHAVRFQPGEFLRRAALVPGPVGALDTASARLNDHRQREHSRAADTAEEIVVLIHEGETGECPAA